MKNLTVIAASGLFLLSSAVQRGAAANQDLSFIPAYTEIGGLASISFGGTLTLQSGFTPIALGPSVGAPTANGQAIATAFNTPTAITLTGSDPNNLSLTFAIVTSPTSGTLAGSGASRTYTPNSGYTGSDSFTFKVNNGFVDSPVATVSITVSATSGLPDLDLSGLNGKTYTLHDTISITYNGNASAYNWEFNRDNGQRAAGAGASGHAASAPVGTTAPRFNLATLPLLAGPYTLRVQAVNGSQTSAWASASITLVGSDLAGVVISPNPWRADRHGPYPITFDNLTGDTTVKIFTVSGHWVKTLPAGAPSTTWDLKDDSGDRVASGLYLYLITTPGGQKKTGQIAVIK